MNLGEVFYRTMQLRGEERALAVMGELRALPIEVVAAKEALVFEAARIKARHPLSHADAFAVATARSLRARLITGDPEIVDLPRGVVRTRRLER